MILKNGKFKQDRYIIIFIVVENKFFSIRPDNKKSYSHLKISPM